jgi:hypothetical protein
MIAKIELTKLGRNCAIAITETGTTITQVYVEDSGNIEMNYNQGNNTVTVTIFGTTSATTPDITTGTFFTIDSGTGAVTITSFATFKTNYATLFLNGGSVPPTIPTLTQVLTAGDSAFNKSITIFGPNNEAKIDTQNFNTYNLTGTTETRGKFSNIDLSFKKKIGFNLLHESFLKPNTAITGTTVENFLPENSGTLLNGEFTSAQTGLFIDYNNEIYALGNDNTSRGLFMNNFNQSYSLGNNAEGLNMNIATKIYTLGYADNFFKIEGGLNRTTIKCEDLQLDGGGLISSIGTTLTGTALLLTINGIQYKINLFQ